MIHNIRLINEPYPVTIQSDNLPYLSEEGLFHFQVDEATVFTFVKENVLFFSTEGIPTQEAEAESDE